MTNPSCAPTYTRCAEVFAQVVEWEGSVFENDPRDSGGATRYGVTLQTLRDYRHDQSLGADAVRDLPYQVAQDIFRKMYWNTVSADYLPRGVDLAVSDMSFAKSPARAAKLLQSVVGVDQDGIVGPRTIAAVRNRNSKTVINDFCDACQTYYDSLHSETFGRGWTNRVIKRRSAALACL